MMSNRFAKIMLGAAVALLLAKSGVSAAIYLWPKAAADNTGSEATLELVRLTNSYRAGLGLRELMINPRLTQAAVNKAKDLLAGQYFSHSSPDGKKFSDWIKEVNYAYFYVGENLAIDFNSPREIFDAWLQSPKHRENIERPEFQEIGMADLRGRFDGRDTDVVVQLFGSRVLGEDEQSSVTSAAGLASNYFSPEVGDSGGSYFGLIDRQLNYLILIALLLLVSSAFWGWKHKKSAPAGDSGKSGSKPLPIGIRITKTPAKRQAPPLISLYTKQTLTANEIPQTSRKTSPPNSRKPATTRSPRTAPPY